MSDKMFEKIIVVKIGGSTLGSHDTILQDLVALQRDGIRLIVVHGGGNIVSQWMERHGTTPRFVRGLRVTDAQSLEVVTAVLSGLVNKQLVAALMNLGGKAMGLSGVDGGLLEAEVADKQLGYVGEVSRVDPDVLYQTLKGGYIPCVAPLGMHRVDGSAHSGSLLNVNGDIVAGELAYTVEAERIIFLTDVEGVMDSSGRVVHSLDSRSAGIFLRSGVAKGGMIPKLEASLRALERVQGANIVDGRKPGALIDCVRAPNTNTNTRITP